MKVPSFSNSNQTVGWFELFYDLVIVAAVGLTNDAFLEDPSTQSALASLLAMSALCWVWFLTTLYNNLYPGEGLLRRVFMLVQMAAIITAALAVDEFGGLEPSRGLIAYGVALLMVVALIYWGGRESPAGAVRRSSGPLAISALICFGGALLSPGSPVLCLVTALIVSILPILLTRYRESHAAFLVRYDHLRERLGLFVLIVLGEGFAQLVHALHGLGSIPNAGVFALTFLVAFALWWIYFDGTFTRTTDLATVRWRLSLIAHLTLVFGMVGTLDVLVLFTVRQQDELGSDHFGYFAVCLATVFLSFAVLGFTVRGRWDAAGWVLVGSGLLTLALGTVVLPHYDIRSYAVMTAAAILVVANALFTVIYNRGRASHRWGEALESAVSGVDEDGDPSGGAATLEPRG